MTPSLTVAYVFALVMMIIVPVLLMRLVCSKRGLPIRVPLIAGAFYLLNLAVNVPLVAYVWPLLFDRNTLQGIAVVAITYGVCEEVARWASFRFVPLMRAHRDESGALAAGLGHGGAESILLGLQFGAGVALVLLFPSRFGEAAIQQVTAPGALGYALAGLDRIPALAAHIALAFLIVMAFRRRRIFLPIAIAAHTLLDFLIFGLRLKAPGYWYEAVFFLTGAIALGFVAVMIKNRVIPPEPTSNEEPQQSAGTPI